MVLFYTDDALGLKISPTVVLVMSLCFIAFVAALNVFGRAKAEGLDRIAFRVEDFDVIQEITWLTKDDEPSNVGDKGMMELNGFPSFKYVLTNGSRAIEDKEDYESDDFDMREGDVITFIVDGILNIRFSNRVHSLVRQSMAKPMIIKMMGKKIRFSTLCSKLYSLWKPT
ncbi:hypothetical protein CXB51_020524 [Gossypium anomalum]|uniref:Uncharacterized protein n=1 Tax=Gossypium anomalum TaxID=47600 RepID=A0A8J5YXF5_9ROSI|nr:hypothetical protein CXB51_020524 [Gossypium anomalum]